MKDTTALLGKMVRKMFPFQSNVRAFHVIHLSLNKNVRFVSQWFLECSCVPLDIWQMSHDVKRAEISQITNIGILYLFPLLVKSVLKRITKFDALRKREMFAICKLVLCRYTQSSGSLEKKPLIDTTQTKPRKRSEWDTCRYALSKNEI